MKAIVYTTYGPPDVLQLREVAKPLPEDKQVLVKVLAASANALDFRRFEKTSLLGRFMDGVLLKAINTVIGADIAGRVEAVGGAVTQFRPGDEVFGQSKGCAGYMEYPPSKLRVYLFSNLGFDDNMHIWPSLGGTSLPFQAAIH